MNNANNDASNINKEKEIFNLDLEKLPEEISISAMTIVCKINTEFYVSNIGRYINLKHNGILSVKHGNSEVPHNRSLLSRKQAVAKIKKKRKSFYNQVTLIVKNSPNKKPANIKLFSNGSIQMTGCKNIDNVIDVVKKVFEELKVVKAVVDFRNDNIIEKPFVSNPDSLDISNLYDIKICMINSNFSIGFNIDRDKLYEISLRNKIECSFDPNKHAGVNIKYDHDEKTISIFVFESGAIIITGACTCFQITGAYNFINSYLLNNYNNIKKNTSLITSTIFDYIKQDDDNKKNKKKIKKKKINI